MNIVFFGEEGTPGRKERSSRAARPEKRAAERRGGGSGGACFAFAGMIEVLKFPEFALK